MFYANSAIKKALIGYRGAWAAFGIEFNFPVSYITFDNRRQPNKSIDDQGYIHGDGVLTYPGEERLHPDQDRGVPGPIPPIQLANFRRGLQDHQYLTLARNLALHSVVDAALEAIVPRVFSEAGERVSFPETGDPYEAARLKLARAIAGAAGEPQAPRITSPVLFDTPEADRILSEMQIFPADNPWNEDISDRPVHADSAAIIRSTGADTSLGYNLDMNFVLGLPSVLQAEPHRHRHHDFDGLAIQQG